MQENPLAVSMQSPLGVHSLAQFSHVNHLADEIARQNRVFQESVPQIDDEVIRSEAISRLVELQRATFECLVTEGLVLPYEELLEREKELGIKLGRIAIADEERNKFNEGIDKDVKIAKEILPDREDDLILLGEERKEAFIPSPEALETDAKLKAELSQEKLFLKNLWDEASQPWPIPQLLSQESKNEATQIVIDFFPEEHNPPDSKEVVERTKRRFEGRLKDASEFLALILAEEKGMAHSLEELGQALYSDDAERGASKVSSLISNFRTGLTTIIGDVLSGEGLVLQQGVRKYFNPQSLEEAIKATRIYRAIPKDKADEKARIIRYADGSHQLETLWKNININDGVEMHEREQTEKESAQEPLGGNTAPSGDPTEISQQTDSEGLGVARERSGAQILKEATSKFITPEWVSEFREHVRATIGELDDEGLIRREQISLREIKRLSRSAIVGTEEMMDRSLKAGLVSRGDIDSEMFTSTQITAMKMLNTHRKVLSKAISRKKQKASLKCIKEEINKLLKEKENR